MTELVVISGKGGTGKTSLVASFAVLAGKAVVADCDVDAADLHLILPPTQHERHPFRSGHQAVIRQADCLGCGLCHTDCRFGAVRMSQSTDGEATYTIDPVYCEGCGVCVRFCPNGSIDFPESLCGVWMVSSTRCGPMVHARLEIAGENSGKLVSTVRREARRVAQEKGLEMIIVDGPPGIGCPVIASLTGASKVLIVTEPTVSGEHDMTRVLELTQQFDIPAAICVNKWDINPAMTERIELNACRGGASVVGRVRYDPAVTAAQIEELAIVENGSPCAADIQKVWAGLGMEEAW